MLIDTKMRTMLDKMRANLKEVEKGLSGKSQAVLGVKSWNIQSTLRDMQFTLKSFTKGYNTQEDLLLTMQKLSEVFTALITVYDRIDSYHDQEKLGDYIASLVATDKIKITDSDLNTAMIRLDVLINSNLMLDQYKSAIDAFKQAVFPFIEFYEADCNLPGNVNVTATTTNLTATASDHITRLKDRLDEYNRTQINGNDKFIISTTFDERFRGSRPFYEWRYEENRQVIADLLSGKRVTVLADIKRGLPVSAVKFREIQFVLRAANSSRQEMLDEELKPFDMNVIHMGVSYYRCGASFYSIDSPSQNILFRMERKDGAPVSTNLVYDKLRDGTVMLSPYAMYSLQLKNALDVKANFNTLKKLADSVDLVLVGRGQYILSEAPVCRQNLNKYYEVVNV